MAGRDLLMAVYYANLTCQILKESCREASGRAAPIDGPSVSLAVADEFERQTLSLKESALQLIRQVPEPRQREVLELHFLDSLTFEEIARQTHYSLRRVYDLYKSALAVIDSIS